MDRMNRARVTRRAGLRNCQQFGFVRAHYKNSGAQPPPVADPRLVAQQQTQSNVDTGVANKELNLTNQVGPTGSTTYNQTGTYTDPITGQPIPQFTQTTQLTPLAQQLLEGTQRTGANILPGTEQLALSSGGAINKPLDFSGVNQDYLNKGPQVLSDQTARAIYGEQKGFLDPQWQEQETQLHDQLSRQGIPVGSEAYNNAMTQFNNAKTQAYTAAQESAVGGATGAASNLFNMALQGQQQNIAQQQTAQQNPLRLLNLAFGGNA